MDISKNKNKSFTLIELLVVIAIFGLLASIILVVTRGATEKARIVKTLQFSASIHHALGAYIRGEWKFEDNFNDTSGNGNHGTSNGVAFVENEASLQLGRAGSFNGSSHYVYARVGDWLGVSRIPWTVLAWFKSPDSGGPIIGITNSPPGGGWNMPFMSLASDGFLYGWAYGGGQIKSRVEFDKWVFGVVVYDPSIGIKLYVDGELTDSSSNTNYSASGSTDYWTTYISGAKPTNVPSYFYGKIDEVRIYEEPLTSAQIKKLYVEGLKRHLTIINEQN